MKEQLQTISAAAKDAVLNCADENEIENLRVKYLGKKGELTAVLRGMGALSAEERPVIGALANDVRNEIENCKGKQFDPIIAQIMIEMIDEDINYTMKEK